jgi:hypothetical protein
MAVPPGKAPILESVGAALRLWRGALPRIWPVAVIGGAALALVQVGVAGLAGGGPLGLFALAIVAGPIASFVYAAFLHPPLGIATDAQRRVGDGLRVFVSMATIGSFLLLVFLVGTMAASMVLGAALAPYEAQLQAAKGNQAATLAVIQQFAQANPGLIALLGVVFAAAWLALSSRLYLAAPATVADARVRTFETWSWTKDNMLRICAARLLLLIPAWLVVTAAQSLIAAAVGFSQLDPFAGARVLEADPARFLIYFIPAEILSLLVTLALEAALSSYLYKGMRPPG